jgi:LL-diaminopimelate aminotransferase
MPRPAARLETLPPYLVGDIPQRKKALLAAGVDVIDLGAGDADLPPPPGVVESLERAARIPAMNRYGFALGHVPFREAASRFMHERFGLTFDPMTEVVPLLGTKEGLSHLALAYVNPGDAVIVPDPGYPAYAGGTALASGEIVRYALRPRTNFLLELDEIPLETLRRARMVYLNYPNNPTAATAPRDYLERIVARCRELDLLLVYDNAYSEFGFDGYVPPSIFEIPGARDVAIEFHSLSKSYNLTGWRCGWAVGRPELVAPLQKVKTFVDTGPFMAIQAAGVTAIEQWRTFIPQNIATFRERRDAAVAAFREAGFTVEAPQATMYCWIALPEGLPSAQFQRRLMDDEGVVVMPGTGFGAGGEGFFRVSFIVPPARLAEAAARAGRVLASFASFATGAAR